MSDRRSQRSHGTTRSSTSWGSPLDAPVDAALTVGAAEGVRLSFDFLRRVRGAEKVLVAGPQYSIVHQTILLAGLTFREVFASREGVFLPGPAEIEAALDASGATVLFLSEPNNPSGEQHSAAEFDEIVKILKQRGTHLVLDKVSADFAAHPDIQVLNYGAALDRYDYWNRTLVVDGLAKRRAVSGLRFGYAVGSPEFIEFIENQRFGGCPPLVAVSGIARDLAYSAHPQRQRLGGGEVSEALWQRFKGLNDASRELLAVSDTSEVEEYRLELQDMYQTIADNRRFAQETLPRGSSPRHHSTQGSTTSPAYPSRTRIPLLSAAASTTRPASPASRWHASPPTPAWPRPRARRVPTGCGSPAPATGPSSRGRSQRCARFWRTTPEAYGLSHDGATEKNEWTEP
ncbi:MULTISPECIES: aminotransferase class I/II-fold pyridoxal phosphate-dependent enzyme [unclassified Streptomyces]|uniref:aminotransferase class I/II-fold pyridoxal phosphate-dependent enzyme n=1 Tax=unclassified Streptomyces TaxID=2593676 RepID=UPI003653C3DC